MEDVTLRTGGTLKEVTQFIASGQKEQVCLIQRNDLMIRLRFIRYKIRGKDYYIATTLLDRDKYPARSIMDLYHARWSVEESFKYLKQELHIQRFHSKNPTGIKQEIATGMILDLLSGIISIRTGRMKKISKGISTKLIHSQFHELWAQNPSVQSRHIQFLLQNCASHWHQSPSGRSFPRRSRKVINRWQKNIAWEWDKKKRQQRRAQSP